MGDEILAGEAGEGGDARECGNPVVLGGALPMSHRGQQVARQVPLSWSPDKCHPASLPGDTSGGWGFSPRVLLCCLPLDTVC